MELIWVPEYQDIRGNEKANEWPVCISSLDEPIAYIDAITPVLTKLLIGYLGKLQPDRQAS